MIPFSWSCRLYSKQHCCPSKRDHLNQYLLQWSHAQSNVETRPAARRSHLLDLASMEPRSVERGNDFVLIAKSQLPVASMEPRSVERGNPPSLDPEPELAARLQWSHAQSNVET